MTSPFAESHNLQPIHLAAHLLVQGNTEAEDTVQLQKAFNKIKV